MNRKGVIYALKDPNTEDIRYIGRTYFPGCRLRDHCNCQDSSEKALWIESLRQSSQEPELIVLEEVSGDKLNLAEREWIARGAGEGWPLLNKQFMPRPPEDQEAAKLTITTLSPEWKKAFRIWCIQNGTTMSDLLSKFVLWINETQPALSSVEAIWTSAEKGGVQ